MDNKIIIDGVSKSFPGVQALKNVSLELHPGKVHALCGENGAGKSTLMKILAGSIKPDEGTISYFGEAYAPGSPKDARDRGVMLVHQEISLVPDMTVAENLFLGILPSNAFGIIGNRRLEKRANEVLAGSGLPIDPSRRVRTLSVAQQQMVEIARASAFRYRVVILDEPTAALTDKDAEWVFQSVNRLRRDNVAVVYITHKMVEVFALADQIIVLRDGEVRGAAAKSEVTEQQVLRMMIGRDIEAAPMRRPGAASRELLRISNGSVPGIVKQADITIHEGEIVGLYGLVGAGRTELAEGIFGIRPLKGDIFWQGKPVRIRSPRDATRLGIALVPEDRKQHGLILSHSVKDNVAYPNLRALSTFGFLNRDRAETVFKTFADRLALKARSPGAQAFTLSGGNQQKVVLAKWLATDPKLLILDEPTRGIDIGAKEEVHRLIRELSERGITILVISSEMIEIIGISHRIITMRDGVIGKDLSGDSINEEAILHAVMAT